MPLSKICPSGQLNDGSEHPPAVAISATAATTRYAYRIVNLLERQALACESTDTSGHRVLFPNMHVACHVEFIPFSQAEPSTNAQAVRVLKTWRTSCANLLEKVTGSR